MPSTASRTINVLGGGGGQGRSIPVAHVSFQVTLLLVATCPRPRPLCAGSSEPVAVRSRTFEDVAVDL